ncbi:MAG: lysophospholipid acyltransferase family protein [Pirellulaceae bacterium]
MNRQPYQTPPCWWSPRLSSFWVRAWRPLRQRRAAWQHGLVDVQVRGLEHLIEASAGPQSVLITPNHPTHADPFALLAAADRFGQPFYFMTAWQVFAMTHRVGRRVLRQHGCFSINREGHDLPALRQAIRILEQGTQPLVIFPEGEVFHLNDRATPFRKGAATAAMLAARRSGRPVACVPCAIKFQYVDDPTPALLPLMDRLERALSWKPLSDMPLVTRVRRFSEGFLSLKETEYFGSPRAGCLARRLMALVGLILGRMEDRFQIASPRASVPERVKQLRQVLIANLERHPANHSQRPRWEQDLDDLFFAMQLFSYPADYLAGHPSIERLAETLDKFEEDVLGAPTASLRGARRAIVQFGEPVAAQPGKRRPGAVDDLTHALHAGVQQMLDQIGPSVATEPLVPAGPLEPIAPEAIAPLPLPASAA